jgi:hypothetical protein
MPRPTLTNRLTWIVIPALLLGAAPGYAEEPQETEKQAPAAVPEPPEIPPALINGEAIEPEVTIIKKEEGTIYEYRINGMLYMVKVEPQVGPPYYLVDRDGDGEFDSRSTDPTKISVPQWILLRW